MPEWRNGRRDGFKIHCPQGCVGSTPTSGIQFPRNYLRGIFLLVSRLFVFKTLQNLVYKTIKKETTDAAHGFVI